MHLSIWKSLLDPSAVTDNEMDQFKNSVNNATVNIHVTGINGWAPFHYCTCHFSKYLFSKEHDLFDIIRLLVQKRAYISA